MQIVFDLYGRPWLPNQTQALAGELMGMKIAEEPGSRAQHEPPVAAAPGIARYMPALVALADGRERTAGDVAAVLRRKPVTANEYLRALSKLGLAEEAQTPAHGRTGGRTKVYQINASGISYLHRKGLV